LATQPQGEALGCKHQLHGVQPVLAVCDVAASVAFFRDTLGFDVDFVEGSPPYHARVKVVGSWGHPVYIHLSLCEPHETGASGETRIYVGRDLDGFFASVRDRGAEVVFAPVSQPWGLREFAVRDPDRHVLRFCRESEAAS